MRLVQVMVMLIGIGCTDSDNTDHDDDLPPACQEIVDACHAADAAGDAASALCHETGHHGDEAECEAEHDDCIATCEAALER